MILDDITTLGRAFLNLICLVSDYTATTQGWVINTIVPAIYSIISMFFVVMYPIALDIYLISAIGVNAYFAILLQKEALVRVVPTLVIRACSKA